GRRQGRRAQQRRRDPPGVAGGRGPDEQARDLDGDPHLPAAGREDRRALGGVRDAGADEADRGRLVTPERTAPPSRHEVVPHDDWPAARRALLVKEKAFSRQREALAAERRALPWEKVEKDYVFDGPSGRETLAQLFAGRSQLVVYQFMFAPDWEEGCPHC